jgi:cysteine synthase A
VRKLFTALQIPFVSIDIDTTDFREANDVPKIRAALAEVAGAPTIPQIYADGTHLGGSMDIIAAANSGALQKLLAEKGIPCSDAKLDPYGFLPNWVKLPKAA